jgi:riboflavin-specific deaminase-like protein
MPTKPQDATYADTELMQSAWRLLLALAAGAPSADVPAELAPWLVRCGGGYAVSPAAPAAARPLLDLYSPLLAPRPLVIGHLGQSLDGHIATATGDSYYVTGPENVRHLHRLRALCDAVVVGAGTVARDDPQLTVRHVEGRNPVRVVLDPRGELDGRQRVFTDGQAQTYVIHAAGLGAKAQAAAEVIVVPADNGRLRLDALLAELAARGLRAVFVEGGGVTVSRFLEAGLLDRLHVAIAALVTGRGRPGLTLQARDKIADCLRPQHRVFAMGGDVLFDCDLRAPPPAVPGESLARVF